MNARLHAQLSLKVSIFDQTDMCKNKYDNYQNSYKLFCSLSENKETSTPTPTRMTRSRRANTSSTETPSPAKQTRSDAAICNQCHVCLNHAI